MQTVSHVLLASRMVVLDSVRRGIDVGVPNSGVLVMPDRSRGDSALGAGSAGLAGKSRWRVPSAVCAPSGELPRSDVEDPSQPEELIGAEPSLSAAASAFRGAYGDGHDSQPRAQRLREPGRNRRCASRAFREAARQEVNAWIRTSHQFDAVFDLDRAIRDPANPQRINPAYDVGDHLMNPAATG